MKKFLLVVMSIMMMGLTLVGCGSDTAEKGAGLSGAVSTNGSTSWRRLLVFCLRSLWGITRVLPLPTMLLVPVLV